MNSRELVMNAIYNKKTPRVPWVPFVGCHAAKLIGVNAEEYFKDADLIVKGVTKAIEQYRPDGIPALFDLQLEAEAMGCRLKWANENPPSVCSHTIEDGIRIADLRVPGENDGRFPIVLDATRRICKKFGAEKAVYGLITGPFTLALHLMGTDIFYNIIDEPERVHELLAFCREVCINTSRMYLEAGVDIIAVVDPMTSQISPDNFAEFVAPYAKAIFDYVRAQGRASMLFVCGNAKNNIEEMCKCGADGLSIDENIPLEYVRDICRRYGQSFGGNIKLTVTMLFGTPADNVNDAMNCIAIGGDTGFILSPGCDMPFAVPAENVKAVASVVFGEVADFMQAGNALEGVKVDLPDFSDKSKVHIDVVTLDSESCAPCQYMMEAVRAAAEPFGDKVQYQEHKIKQKEGVACMIRLGVENIPTIVVDGKIEFISIIPDHDLLVSVLLNACKKKGIVAHV
ncbi:MAG: uroporphyrinogen decarboxylase family protein [Clostridia bacterium]|nr:uroporphyrinogen decarboxylase family protein [Clostridia bacterium]